VIAASLFLALSAITGVLVLENDLVRVEIDPEVMAVRYLGPPMGPNLVEPLYVSRLDRRGKAWLDAGGVGWEVVAASGSRDAALRRGPAEVLAHTVNRVTLLSPVSQDAPLRLKLDFLLADSAPEVEVTAVLSTDAGDLPAPVALRCLFRLWPGTVARAPDGPPPALFPIAGTSVPAGTRVDKWDGTLLNAGAVGALPLVTSTLAPKVMIERMGWRLSREPTAFAGAGSYTLGRNVHAANDPSTHTYGVICDSPTATITPAQPLSYREVWRLAPLD
jgi:hypothetical protein